MQPCDKILSGVSSRLNLDRRLKEHALVSMWPSFVKQVLADRSRPLFIDSDRNLVISAADASTGQELVMDRPRLLKEIRQAARSLGLDINGLRIDLKNYSATQDKPPIKEETRSSDHDATEAEIAAIILSDEQVSQLAALASGLDRTDKDSYALTSRMLKLFEQELRYQSWRRQQGWPACRQCGVVASRMHAIEEGRAHLCPACMSLSGK